MLASFTFAHFRALSRSFPELSSSFAELSFRASDKPFPLCYPILARQGTDNGKGKNRKKVT